ncbi:DEP domain-containing protein 1B isoform X4 [Patella vulgata]|uniref:DEP domain-containing protein 1B isoform X4 n=1 Tax=Patella vulgata TaxID=6465 RepID=UPI00217FEB21|nr:DEP domain-containing protein 1B isoform X4 [Patella vulgata]
MEKRSSSDTDVYMGPYRATKLWNDVIYTFRNGMPCGKHRRYMRTYEDCFVASCAVEWVHNYMKNNPNFGQEVTRVQTVQLLQKIYKAGVFEDVRGPKHGRADFAENGRIYRFTSSTSPKTTNSSSSRTPLSTRKNIVNCDTPDTTDGCKQIDDDELRSCHLVAKILTPGEIEDVWKTFTLSRLQLTIGVDNLTDIMDSQLVNGHNIMHNCIYINKSGLVSNVQPKDQLPPWAMSAMKCLARWPEKVEENLPNYPGFEKDVFGVVKDYFTNLEEPLMTYDMYEVITNVFEPAADSMAPDSARVLSSNSLPVTHYETAFGPDNRTVTRVYFSQGVSTDYGHHQSSDEEELGMPLETHFDVSTDFRRRHSDSGNYQVNFTRVKSLDGIDRAKRRYSRKNSSSSKNGRYSIHLSKSLHNGDTPVSGKTFGILPRNANVARRLARPSSSSSYDSCGYQPILDGSKYSRSNKRLSSSSPDLANMLAAEDAKMSNPISEDEPAENGKQKSDCESLSAEDCAKKALQLVCLLLPPANRRKLQLLLKLMYKMTINQDLNLDPSQSTRSLVLETFYKCILSCPDENEMDHVLVIQLVSFLMDHHTEVFSVPTELKLSVEDRLTTLQKPQIKYSPDDPLSLRYCRQVAVSTFESDKQSNSQKALTILLEEIINDTNMADKDKKKRLKMFQKTYPEIYTKRFPTAESAAEVFPAKLKIKQPLLVKPFMKLRGLRM